MIPTLIIAAALARQPQILATTERERILAADPMTMSTADRVTRFITWPAAEAERKALATYLELEHRREMASADFNRDGMVDTRDVTDFLNTWNVEVDR